MHRSPEAIRRLLLEKKQELQAVESELQSLTRDALLALPAQVGVESVDALIDLLLPIASDRYRTSLRPPKTGLASTGSRRERTKVTPEMRTRVADLLRSSKLTAQQVADSVDVSVSLVNKLKANLGLTGAARKNAAPKGRPLAANHAME